MGQKKTQGAHLDVVHWAPESLASLPSSLYLSETSYVGFIYKAQDF